MGVLIVRKCTSHACNGVRLPFWVLHGDSAMALLLFVAQRPNRAALFCEILSNEE